MARTVSSQAERVQPMQVQPVSLNQTDWRNDPGEYRHSSTKCC